MKATEALKSVEELANKGKKVSCPQSDLCPIRYDARSYRVALELTFRLSLGRHRASRHCRVGPQMTTFWLQAVAEAADGDAEPRFSPDLAVSPACQTTL